MFRERLSRVGAVLWCFAVKLSPPYSLTFNVQMEAADVQPQQIVPVLQENTSPSQTNCVSHSADCADKDLILNMDTSACKGSDSIHDPGVNIGTGFQEIEVNKHVLSAKRIEVNCTHDANKLQSGERTVSDLSVVKRLKGLNLQTMI
ncbi:hypothetical protein X975_08705, partial [Stegodyphus mimosarum]